MTDKAATFVKQVNGNGDGRVFRVDPPMKCDGGTTDYVWVSAATLPMGFGCETYIFASDKDGNVTDWLELAGSIKNTLSHAEALAAAGYIIAASRETEPTTQPSGEAVAAK